MNIRKYANFRVICFIQVEEPYMTDMSWNYATVRDDVKVTYKLISNLVTSSG